MDCPFVCHCEAYVSGIYHKYKCRHTNISLSQAAGPLAQKKELNTTAIAVLRLISRRSCPVFVDAVEVRKKEENAKLSLRHSWYCWQTHTRPFLLFLLPP